MTPFQQHLAEDRRLCILRMLEEGGGMANDSVLYHGLEQLGHRTHTRDTVRDDIRFLKDAGLVVDEWLGTILIAKITKRGVDVATGRIQVEGVKKPSLGV